MALVTRIVRGEKERNSVHQEVECTYVTFVADGKKFFQLDTYGSPTRKLKGKVSQSLQLDERSARELVAALERIFPRTEGGEPA